ncbi:MAG: membrane integrity-associated transporter subunit PqiC [Gammaproteobacteria bacterium]|nr:membrane integrity-associated transporter subunit PqiC [Gammaproteobacteria bacterium]
MQAIARLVVLVVALGVAACATTPSANFFTLNPADVEPQVARSDLSLALGPIDLPGYLDRPQIVTRAGGNRLSVDEFNRWGGLLEEEISRVLAEHLSRRLGTDRIYSYPSRVAADTDYRVVLEIRRFDGILGGEVVLDLAWSLVDDRTAEVLLTRQAAYRGAVPGSDYGAYAAALSALVIQFGDDLAAALAQRPQRPR